MSVVGRAAQNNGEAILRSKHASEEKFEAVGARSMAVRGLPSKQWKGGYRAITSKDQFRPQPPTPNHLNLQPYQPKKTFPTFAPHCPVGSVNT